MFCMSFPQELAAATVVDYKVHTLVDYKVHTVVDYKVGLVVDWEAATCIPAMSTPPPWKPPEPNAAS